MLESGFGTEVLPSSAVVLPVAALDHWFGEKLLLETERPQMPSNVAFVFSATLAVPLRTMLVFLTGCWITAARPVSQAEPYFEAGDCQRTSSYGPMPSRPE